MRQVQEDYPDNVRLGNAVYSEVYIHLSVCLIHVNGQAEELLRPVFFKSIQVMDCEGVEVTGSIWANGINCWHSGNKDTSQHSV